MIYDPIGPSLPRLAGDYATTITIAYQNSLDTRADTLFAVITLPNVGRRGNFMGQYVIGTEVGPFGGLLFPSRRIELPTFGPGPQPIAQVASVRALYPQCDFSRVGTGQLLGELRGDTLLVTGQASLPCTSESDPAAVDLTTSLRLDFFGVR
ncbi:MAG: hypothetical protein ACREMJ_09375 [Gemmatimonadales bacterium]